MTTYTVIGFERTTRMMKVEADTEEEAVAKAKRGEYDSIDSEPGPLIDKGKWHVGHEGWFGG